MAILEKTEKENTAEDIEKNIANIKHKFIVISGKGGVGKTTVAVSIAYAMDNPAGSCAS